VSTYPKLGIVPFGKHLIESGDLDPVYIALHEAKLEPTLLKRWLLVYWTFYHCGVASYIADADNVELFWERWSLAASNLDPAPISGRWPRGHERRHMRGMNAVRCWEAMAGRYFEAPERFVDVTVPGPTTCREVIKRVRDHVQFGPWIGFKVADMTERVLGTPVDFTNAEVFIFDDPRKAALLFWRLSQNQPEGARPRDEGKVLELAVHFLKESFANHVAPPRNDRPIGLQEVETVLCKWKSHLNGHYPLNNDILEIRAGLQPWCEHSETARRVLAAMPEAK
jgi:hypothetical protein